MLSTDAQALCISGNIPHNAVPSPLEALYLSINTEGNSQESTTSTKGGHYSSNMNEQIQCYEYNLKLLNGNSNIRNKISIAVDEDDYDVK